MNKTIKERADELSTMYYGWNDSMQAVYIEGYTEGAKNQFEIDKQMAIDIVSGITQDIIAFLDAPQINEEPYKSKLNEFVQQYVDKRFKQD